MVNPEDGALYVLNNQTAEILAVGKIVEAVSHSKFWPSTAIFIIEDDAQAGPDHVDARRTVGLVLSSYIKRHTVDHTFYTTSSFIRTMELVSSPKAEGTNSHLVGRMLRRPPMYRLYPL